MAEEPFGVHTHGVRLAVWANARAVTRIRLNGRATRAPATATERRAARELREYLAGRRTGFEIPIEPRGTRFQRRVWRALTRIPYGETRTYGQIARAIGVPGAARAVGQANNRNPIPIVIPCHRVVAANGPGGFGGGLALKRRLLAIEGVRV